MNSELTCFLRSNPNQFFFRFQSCSSFGTQMRVAVFLMCMCFLLLCGESSLYAGIHNNNNSNHALIQHSKEQPRVNLAHANQVPPLIRSVSLGTEKEYFINDEVEDEDTHNCSAQKYRLIARSHATHAYPSYPSILNYLCNCYKATPSFCPPASDKCILQSVLRI